MTPAATAATPGLAPAPAQRAGSGPDPGPGHRIGGHGVAAADAAAGTRRIAGDAIDAGPGERPFAEFLEAPAGSPPSAAAPPDTPDAPEAPDVATSTMTPAPADLLLLMDGPWRAGPAPAAEPGAAAGPAPAFAAGQPMPDMAEALPASSQAGAHGAPLSSPATPAGTAAALPITAVAPGSPATSTMTAPETVQELAGTIADPLGIATAGATTQPVAQRVQVVPLPPLPMPADPQTGFDDGFGSRIAWVAGQQLGHAEIRLNPEHVGPIDVRVRMDGDQVHTEFHSAHADVRQAIEASLPRLRELLGQHGFHLGQADVGQRDPGRQPRTRAAPGHDEAGTVPAAPAATAALPRRSHGLLDAYA